MRVVVEYLAHIKRAGGTPRDTIEIPAGATLADVLGAVSVLLDAPFRELLLDAEGKPRRSLLFFVADRNIDGSHTLNDGDVVSILAPMAGG